MRTIQLTGIGNALVDVEFNVSEAELASFGVTKGAMTLTEPQRQAEILSALSVQPVHQSSGGSVANSLIAFAQFGGSACFLSVVGNDNMGSFYTSEFSDLNIKLVADALPGLPTGSCIVLITPDGERTLNTTLGANVTYGRHALDEQVLRNSEWLLLEGYKLTEESGAEALEVAAFTAKRNNRHVAISCSDGFIVNVFSDRLNALLQYADMIFCNEVEACALVGEENANEAFRSLKSRFRGVALTRGTNGSLVHWYGKDAVIPAFAVDTIDTTGAGDMYAGAFLYAVLHGHSVEHAGRLASYSSAQVVKQFGARLRTSHIEVRDTVLQHAPTTITS